MTELTQVIAVRCDSCGFEVPAPANSMRRMGQSDFCKSCFYARVAQLVDPDASDDAVARTEGLIVTVSDYLTVADDRRGVLVTIPVAWSNDWHTNKQILRALIKPWSSLQAGP